MIEFGILIAGSFILEYLLKRFSFWHEKHKYIQEHREYIQQLEKMDNEYHPEKPDIETALKCKEYLFQIFPNGIQEKTQNMTHEEIIELFKKIEKDAEQLLDVHIDNIDFYTTEEPPYCNYCGFYCHDEHSFHINTVFILSRIPELIEEQVYTIFHELKHARQWAAIEGKLNGTKDYGYSDEQIKIWAENFNNYIPVFISDELYRKQPVEKDSFGFELIIKGEHKTYVAQ